MQAMETHTVKSFHYCRALAFAIMVMAGIFFWGCKQNPTGTDTPSPIQRDINTPAYHERVLKWNASENRREYFSWLGTRGAEGCEIFMNIHDGPGSVPGNFNATAAQEALRNARDIWTQAIADAGISCEIVTSSQREGQTLFTGLPRIDLRFVRQIQNGSTRGAAGVTLNRNARQFSRVEINIATEYVMNGQTEIMTHNDYMSTSAHEFGHALGIFCLGACEVHSPHKNDVMYSPSRYWTLSHGDKATLEFIYGGEAYYKPQGSQSFEGSMPRRPGFIFPGLEAMTVEQTLCSGF